MKTIKVIAALIVGCIVCAFIQSAIHSEYKRLDSFGWIPHQEETVITASSDWLVGESKECWSARNSDYADLANKFHGATADQLAKAIDPSTAGDVLSSVSCDDGPQHKMKVTFYGRRIQHDNKIVTWRCTREQPIFLIGTRFTCYQTGGKK